MNASISRVICNSQPHAIFVLLGIIYWRRKTTVWNYGWMSLSFRLMPSRHDMASSSLICPLEYLFRFVRLVEKSELFTSRLGSASDTQIFHIIKIVDETIYDTWVRNTQLLVNRDAVNSRPGMHHSLESLPSLDMRGSAITHSVLSFIQLM